ncbi:hypothetical protein CMV_002300 [Castanea mollissima]|uniref:Uncharacterized protein n=1 Tax=Castanea mollissima TaxID=60419 RepID=A0A8J4RJE1_9ROSI|nr:hypothetical protein CMV_002300 [Castanea mollissima]
MAFARLALKSLQQRVLASPSCAYSLLGEGICERNVGGVQRQRWGNEIVKRFTTTASDKVVVEKTSDGKDVTVSEGKKVVPKEVVPKEAMQEVALEKRRP